MTCATCRTAHPIVDGIPRFVSPENYASSFGYQWKQFSRIQLDSANGTRFSEERFRAISGWTPEDLAGKLVLDAGCGAGRFAEVVVRDGARLVACDLSEAVEACRQNLLPAEPLICQASIYELPFAPGSFDYVYCIGVVQHTPDPERTIRKLAGMVRPGGFLALWIYERDWKAYVGTLGFRTLLRPLVSRLPRSAQLTFCRWLVRLFLPLARLALRCGAPGRYLARMLPIASAHIFSVPLGSADFDTWVFLDTFDMYTPAFDRSQRFDVVARILREEGLERIERHPHGAIAVTARRPDADASDQP